MGSDFFDDRFTKTVMGCRFRRGVTGVPPVDFGLMGNLGNKKAANLP